MSKMSDNEITDGVFNVLLVEDNPADIVLANEVFVEASSSVRIHAVTSGQDAMDFLRKELAYSEVPTPDLILLDLNLPGKDGREVLREIKTDQDLKRLPVVVLSSSQSEDDRRTAYDLHANAFMLKAATLDDAIEVAKAILSYWANMVSLPPK
jgi:chemotaxis family two-component system response regulator Rcp1